MITCSHCGKIHSKTLKACSQCKVVRYCGKECQTAHWKGGHSKACQKAGACPGCGALMDSAGAKGALCARCSE